METRVAVIAVIVENEDAVAELNALLHQYGMYIIGRMGVPYRARGVNIISVVLDAPQPAISPAHSTAAVASAAIFLNILFPPSILYRVLRRVTYQSDQTAQTRP